MRFVTFRVDLQLASHKCGYHSVHTLTHTPYHPLTHAHTHTIPPLHTTTFTYTHTHITSLTHTHVTLLTHTLPSGPSRPSAVLIRRCLLSSRKPFSSPLVLYHCCPPTYLSLHQEKLSQEEYPCTVFSLCHAREWGSAEGSH